MRSALFTLALVTAIACGGRAGVMGDEGTEADGGSLSGGASNGGASSGGARSSGGRRSSGGAPNQLGGATSKSGGRVSSSGGRATTGGAPALGGRAGSGGSFTGGSGGEGGVGGEPGCFTAVQSGDNYCISVAICGTAQYESLCSYEPTTAVVTCTCFLNGVAGFTVMGVAPTPPALCQLAITHGCSVP